MKIQGVMVPTSLKQVNIFLFAFLLLFSSFVFANEKAKKNNTAIVKKITQSKKTLSKKRKLANDGEIFRKKIVESYFNCFTKVNSIQTCVNNLISSDLKDSEKERFYTWLQFNPYKFTGLRECTDKDIHEIRFFGLSTPDYICASIVLDKQVKDIVFFFKPESNAEIKIFSFYF